MKNYNKYFQPIICFEIIFENYLKRIRNWVSTL